MIGRKIGRNHFWILKIHTNKCSFSMPERWILLKLLSAATATATANASHAIRNISNWFFGPLYNIFDFDLLKDTLLIKTHSHTQTWIYLFVVEKLLKCFCNYISSQNHNRLTSNRFILKIAQNRLTWGSGSAVA